MFTSAFKPHFEFQFPHFSGLRVMMMPFVLEDSDSLPSFVQGYKSLIERIAQLSGKSGIGYLTIDEAYVREGETQRRPGKHVDGMYQGKIGAWGGGWGAVGDGMYLASSDGRCRAWNQDFSRMPVNDGECDHLAAECGEGELMKPSTLYWLDGLCVHESLPMLADGERQFIRVSMPSSAPWFEGYTENPCGVRPAGDILSRRQQMDYRRQ